MSREEPAASRVPWPLRLLLAGLSGLLAQTVTHLPWPQDLRSLLQGGLFGALVLVPLIGSVPPRIGPVPGRLGRGIALVLAGMLIQLGAVRFALRLHAAHAGIAAAIILAGIAGALAAAGAARVLVPLPGGWHRWLAAATAGLVGGLALSLPALAHRGLVWTYGMVVWQVLVCAALGFGRSCPLAPARTR